MLPGFFNILCNRAGTYLADKLFPWAPMPAVAIGAAAPPAPRELDATVARLLEEGLSLLRGSLEQAHTRAAAPVPSAAPFEVTTENRAFGGLNGGDYWVLFAEGLPVVVAWLAEIGDCAKALKSIQVASRLALEMPVGPPRGGFWFARVVA